MTGADIDLIWTASGRRALDLTAEAFSSRAILNVRRARAMVSADRKNQAGLLIARRLDLCRLLQEYQRFKHSAIFNPIIALGIDIRKKVAQALKFDCLCMGQVFDLHCSRWAYLSGSNWAAYTRDMVVMSDVLINHLETERSAIRHLLAVIGDEARPEGNRALAA